MKYGVKIAGQYIRNRSKWYRIWVDSPLAILALMGFLRMGAIGLIVGIVLAIPFTMYMEIKWPRWAWELDWHDIERAVRNFERFGRKRFGKMVFSVAGRKFCVVKNERRAGSDRLALWIPERPWRDVINETDKNALLKIAYGEEEALKRRKMGTSSPVNRKGILWLCPNKDNTVACLSAVEYLVRKAGDVGLNHTRVSARGTVGLVWMDYNKQDAEKVNRYTFTG